MTIKETLKKLSVKLLGEIKRNTTTPTIKGATFTFNDGKEAAMKVTKISGDSYQDTTTLIGVSDVSDNLELEDTTDKDFKIRYFGKSSQEDFLVGVKEGEGSVTCNDSKSGDFAKLSIAGKSTQENYKIGVASGTSVHVEDADEGQMACVDLVKNLLKPTRDTSTKNGVTCTNNGDGTYTLNGTASSNCAFIVAPISTELVNYLPAKGSIKFVGFPKSGINGSCSLAIQFKTDGDGKPFDDTGDGVEITYNTVEYYNGYNCFINVYSGCVFNNAIFKPMLTTDLNATYDTYVPYEGYEITACGKNICDGIFEVGSFDNSGNPVTSNTRLRTKNFQPVRKNENISISATNGFLILEIFVYDKDKNFIKKQLISTFKVSDDGFIKFSIKNSNNTTVNVGDSVGQIEYSDAPTDYEPYVSNTFTVTPDTTYAKLQSYSPITNVFNNYGTDMTVQYKKLAAAESADTDLTAPIPSMPSEIQSVGRKGRNLLEVTAQSQTINGVTFTVNDDGTVTVNGTNSSSTVSAIFDMRTEEIEIQEDCILSSNANSKVSFYFLLNGNTDYSIMDGGSKTFKKGDKIKQFRIFVPKSATATNFVFKPMLELGTVAHDYEPYVGDGKIVEVESCGKNLFDKNTIRDGDYDSPNSNTGIRMTAPYILNVKKGQTLYFYMNSTDFRYEPVFVTKNNELIDYLVWTNNKSTMTAQQDCFLTIIFAYGDDVHGDAYGNKDLLEFVISYEDISAYEPYQGTTSYLPLTEPLRSIDDVRDELIVYADGSGKLIRRIGGTVIDGINNYIELSDVFCNLIVGGRIGYAKKSYSIINKTEFFNDLMNTNEQGFVWVYRNYLDAIIPDVTQESLNEILNGKSIIYEIDPIITDLTPSQVAEFEKLQSYSDTTNVICSDELSPAIHAEYYKTYGAEQESTDITYPTPYAPREIYNVGDKIKGYNLLELTCESKTVNGVTFTVDKDRGTITANGTATSTIWFRISQNMTLDSKTYTISDGINEGRPDGTYLYDENQNFNAVNKPTNTFKSKTIFKPYIRINENVTCYNLIFKPMLTEGTVQRPFEPFKCAESIAVLDNKIEGEVVGKNLYEEGDLLNTFLSRNILTFSTPYEGVLTTQLDIEGVSPDNGVNNIEVIYYYDDETRVTTKKAAPKTDTIKIIATSDGSKKVKSIKISYGSGKGLFNYKNIQIEKGSEATSYQPYIGTSYSIPLTETLKAIPVSDDATEFTYQDVDGKKWIADEIVKYPDGSAKLIKRIEKKKINNMSFSYSGGYFIANISDIKPPETETDCLNILLCEKLKVVDNLTGITIFDNSITIPKNKKLLYVHCSSCKDVGEFNNVIDNANIYYRLATPVITDLTSDQLAQLSSLHLDNTITTISNTADSPMEVSYYKLDGAVADENDLTVPTPDFPSEIKSVGDYNFDIVSDDGNGNESRSTISRTLRKVGNVCDTIECTDNGWKLVQRIGFIESYNNENIVTDYISSTGELSIGAKIIYVLKESIETDFTDSEIIRLLKLKSFDGTTNVYTTDDLEPELEVDYANNDVMATAMSNECNIMKIKTSLPKIVSANIVDENGNRIFNVNIKNPIL